MFSSAAIVASLKSFTGEHSTVSLSELGDDNAYAG
jgi:hypothetical protein